MQFKLIHAYFSIVSAYVISFILEVICMLNCCICIVQGEFPFVFTYCIVYI